MSHEPVNASNKDIFGHAECFIFKKIINKEIKLKKKSMYII